MRKHDRKTDSNGQTGSTPLDKDDIALLKTYGLGPYSGSVRALEADLKDIAKRVNDLCGIKESDTGLTIPSQWDLTQDKQTVQEEQPLQVARCTKIISANTDEAKYMVKQARSSILVVDENLVSPLGVGDRPIAMRAQSRKAAAIEQQEVPEEQGVL